MFNATMARLTSTGAAGLVECRAAPRSGHGETRDRAGDGEEPDEAPRQGEQLHALPEARSQQPHVLGTFEKLT